MLQYKNRLLYGMLMMLLISGCKKEEKESLSVCVSQYENVVDVQIDYDAAKLCKRSFVYRSDDNITYSLVREIDISKVENKHIVFTDSTPKSEKNYYYKASYGGVLSCTGQVDFRNNFSTFRIFPNPTDSILNVESGYLCGYSYSIFDITGSIVLSGNNIFVATKQIDVSSLANGVYLLKISAGNHLNIFRFLKQ